MESGGTTVLLSPSKILTDWLFLLLTALFYHLAPHVALLHCGLRSFTALLAAKIPASESVTNQLIRKAII